MGSPFASGTVTSASIYTLTFPCLFSNALCRVLGALRLSDSNKSGTWLSSNFAFSVNWPKSFCTTTAASGVGWQAERRRSAASSAIIIFFILSHPFLRCFYSTRKHVFKYSATCFQSVIYWGSSISTQVPSSIRLSMPSFPPCIATMRFTSARPSPTPPAFLERDLSTM